MANPTHTDLTYLKSLSPGNVLFVKEMLQMFLTQTPDNLKKLQAAYDSQQWADVRATAHAMKSMLSFMGIVQLADVIKTIEESAATQTNLSAIQSLIDKLKEICEAAYSELETELKSLDN